MSLTTRPLMFNLNLLIVGAFFYEMYFVLFHTTLLKNFSQIMVHFVKPRWIEYLELWASIIICSLNLSISRTHNLPLYGTKLFLSWDKTLTFFLWLHHSSNVIWDHCLTSLPLRSLIWNQNHFTLLYHHYWNLWDRLPNVWIYAHPSHAFPNLILHKQHFL